ncbi:MAG: beta-lactamase family protein [bacterium]|nr:beta-lactamase family protein [bacterium]
MIKKLLLASIAFMLPMLSVTPAFAAAPLCETNLRQFSAVIDTTTSRVICEPINPYLRYGVASVSKTITALITLKLVDVGGLKLDQSFIAQLKPGTLTAPRDQRWNSVTVRQLLNHSGGLSNYYSWFFNQGTAATFNNSWRTAAARSTSTSLIYSPGYGYKYSNMNYALLGLLIEQKTATSYPVAAENYIFRNLGIPSNHYRFVSDYGPVSGADIIHPYWVQWKYSILGPAGGWYLSPRAAALIMSGFQRRILTTPATINYWQKGSTGNGNYGLGNMYYGSGIRGHTGTIAGVRSSVALNLNYNRSAAILYNGTGYTSGSDMKAPSINLSINYRYR